MPNASIDAKEESASAVQATDVCLILETEQWLAVADEIRQGRCNVQTLTPCMVSKDNIHATKAVTEAALSDWIAI
jgi:hypothetical protein